MMQELQTDSAAPAAAAGPPEPAAFLAEILRLMGFQVEVSLSVDEERVLLNISGPEAGLLIGKKGQTLDALQFLLNKIIAGRGLEEHKPVVVDSNGYRERRVEALMQLAQRLRDKAMRTGKIVAVNPMSAHDRRIIHIALKDTEGVTTRSEGEGIYRRLLIVPDQKL